MCREKYALLLGRKAQTRLCQRALIYGHVLISLGEVQFDFSKKQRPCVAWVSQSCIFLPVGHTAKQKKQSAKFAGANLLSSPGEHTEFVRAHL